MKAEKEFLYVGFYYDEEDNFILKIGTTNNLERRRKQHNRYYLKAAHNPMPEGNKFEYLWHTPLVHKNTLKYEDSNREKWKSEGVGEFIRNDRFVCSEPPHEVEVAIRKIYKIPINKLLKI